MTRPELEASRRRVEERLREVRAALASEVGLRPRRPAWVLPVVGLALGLGLAWGIGSSRRRRRRVTGDRRALRSGPDA